MQRNYQFQDFREILRLNYMRNIGIPTSHTKIAIDSILKGISKLDINKNVIEKDLDENWAIISEAVKQYLEGGISKPYELLKI